MIIGIDKICILQQWKFEATEEGIGRKGENSTRIQVRNFGKVELHQFMVISDQELINIKQRWKGDEREIQIPRNP